MRTWPGVVQFFALLLVADFTQYWVHRTFHAVPALWRFHAVHHSAEQMDWLAGSRLHLVDIAVTRGLTYVPIYVLGFAEGPLLAYLVVVSVQATFIHANVRFDFGPAEMAGRHAAVSSLASRGRTRSDRQELRGASAGARLAVWHDVPAASLAARRTESAAARACPTGFCASCSGRLAVMSGHVAEPSIMRRRACPPDDKISHCR